jgi:hypothetical protein
VIREIPFAPGYFVTTDGIVTNSKGVVLTPIKHHTGYIVINLYPNGKKLLATMHKVMAETYIPKPDSTSVWTVNHKNKDKTDYSLDQLEWLSNADNIEHGQGLPVEQILNGVVVVATYGSSQSAARAIGKPNGGSMIRQVCKGVLGRKSYSGFEWQYKYKVTGGF